MDATRKMPVKNSMALPRVDISVPTHCTQYTHLYHHTVRTQVGTFHCYQKVDFSLNFAPTMSRSRQLRNQLRTNLAVHGSYDCCQPYLLAVDQSMIHTSKPD